MQTRRPPYQPTHLATLENLVASFIQTAEASFVPRGEYAENRDAQDKVLERLTQSIDRLNEQLARLPSQREWGALVERVDRLETRQGQGQRFQMGTLIQQNKALMSFLAGAIVAALSAFLQGHLHIQ